MTDTREWTTHPALVATDLGHRWLADVSGTDTNGNGISVTFDSLNASSESGHTASLIGARVDQDITSTPATRATVTVADVPESFLDRLDPRRDLTLSVRAGYDTGDYSWGDIHPLCQVKVSRITRDESGRGVIYGASVEQVILDNAELEPALDVTGVAAHTLVAQLAAAAGGYIETNGLTGPTTTLRAEDAWDGIQEVCNAQSWRVAADPSGILQLRAVPLGTEASRADLTTGKAGTLIRRQLEQSRDAYANRVRLVYEWRDSAGVSKRIVGTSTNATYDVAGNRRTATVRRATSTTQARANYAASVLLARMIRRGRTYRVTALAHYWLQPGDVVTVTAPGTGAAERALVEAITYSSDGTMELNTRSTV